MKDRATKRFVKDSYPLPPTDAEREAVHLLLRPWLEQDPLELPASLKRNPFTCGRMRKMAELLDVSTTGLSNVLDSDRSTIYRRMIDPKLDAETPIAMWAVKLIRLGIFGGYYIHNPTSRTLEMARKVVEQMNGSRDLWASFRLSARLYFQGAPQAEYMRMAKEQLRQLWPDTTATTYARERGIEPAPVAPESAVALIGYKRPDHLLQRFTSAHLGKEKALGAVIIDNINFDRWQRDIDGKVQINGDYVGAVFSNCTMKDMIIWGDTSGATFSNCTFNNVSLCGKLRDAKFLNCTGSVEFDCEDKRSMENVLFQNCRLDLLQGYLDMPGATFIDSFLSQPDVAIGMYHESADKYPFRCPNIYGLGRMCVASDAERAAMMDGVRLVRSFVDLPANFFGEELRAALLPEDAEAWLALKTETGTELSEARGEVLPTGLMGDALAVKYFPELADGVTEA